MILNKQGYIDCSDDDFKIFALSALRSSMWRKEPNEDITVIRNTLLKLVPCMGYGAICCMVNDISDSPFLGGPQEGMENFWKPLKDAVVEKKCLINVDSETDENTFLKPESPEFGIMAAYAVDYAVGRRTYVPSTVVNYLIPALNKLSKETLDSICYIIDSATSLGDSCDEVEWVKLRNAIRK